MTNYQQQSKDLTEKLIPTIRKLSDLEQQKAILAAFPFGKHNPEAWKIYFKEINKVRGGRMGGV